MVYVINLLKVKLLENIFLLKMVTGEIYHEAIYFYLIL
jgi:hypothetical protein